MKKLQMLGIALLCTMLIANFSFAGEIHKIGIEEAQATEQLPQDYFPEGAPGQPSIPYQDDTQDSPGLLVGKTFYDNQTNGSTGDRISKHDCGIHICWMNGIQDWTGERQIYYNFIDESGDPFWGQDGTPVSSGQRDGYTTMDVKPDDGIPIITFHSAVEGEYMTEVALDAGCGLGLFTSYNVPNEYPGFGPFIWPYVAYDNNDRIHIVHSEWTGVAGEPHMQGHLYSEDLGNSWPHQESIEDLMDLSMIVVASHVDDKVAIVWTKPKTLVEPNQYDNDIAYVESEDGETWDYNSQVNITNYQTDDTIRAYCDVDATYDTNGNLHIIWNTPGYWDETGMITADACFLWHWSEETGINMIYDAWHASFPGAWNRSASKMSIAIDANNSIHVIWTHFDDIDVSAGGWSNGELYYANSDDLGASWSDPVNLTQTATPGCLPGDCDCDHYSTLAIQADEYLYITYIEDKDAGAVAQTEGAQTQNVVRFLQIENPLWISGVEDNEAVPSEFGLAQNYPNPFNASTNIEFALQDASNVTLKIYNLLGEEVAELANGKMNAGEHTVKWNAADYTSGVYLYRLKINDATETRRMVLLK